MNNEHSMRYAGWSESVDAYIDGCWMMVHGYLCSQKYMTIQSINPLIYLPSKCDDTPSVCGSYAIRDKFRSQNNNSN